MNCHQFDQRVQQQLDERANLIFDAALQQHARQCSHCAYLLSLYGCLGDAFPTSTSPAPRTLSESPEKISGSHRRVNWRLVGSLLAASVVLMILPLLSGTRDARVSNGNLSRVTEFEPSVGSEFAPKASDPMLSVANLPDLNVLQWLPTGVPVNLNYVSRIQLPNLSNIDVSSLVPQEPMNAVRLLPTTIESIEPIYRYTSDLPGVKSFSSGLNCTLTILRQNIPNLGQNSVVPQNTDELDLGLRRHFIARFCC